MSQFRVHISKDNLIFAAAHFVSYDGDTVEPLHGHNYRFSVTIEGPTDSNAYVFNFVTIKRMMKRIGDELDHRLLLPESSPHIRVERQDDGGVLVHVGARWYRFPGEDTVILPVTNTTVEMLATHLWGRLREELGKLPQASHLVTLEVEVEETFGQSAVYRRALAEA